MMTPFYLGIAIIAVGLAMVFFHYKRRYDRTPERSFRKHLLSTVKDYILLITGTSITLLGIALLLGGGKHIPEILILFLLLTIWIIWKRR